MVSWSGHSLGLWVRRKVGRRISGEEENQLAEKARSSNLALDIKDEVTVGWNHGSFVNLHQLQVTSESGAWKKSSEGDGFSPHGWGTESLGKETFHPGAMDPCPRLLPLNPRARYFAVSRSYFCTWIANSFFHSKSPETFKLLRKPFSSFHYLPYWSKSKIGQMRCHFQLERMKEKKGGGIKWKTREDIIWNHNLDRGSLQEIYPCTRRIQSQSQIKLFSSKVSKTSMATEWTRCPHSGRPTAQNQEAISLGCHFSRPVGETEPPTRC